MMSDEKQSTINVEEFRKIIAKDANLPQNIGIRRSFCNGNSFCNGKPKPIFAFFNLDTVFLERFLKTYDDKDLQKSFELLKKNFKSRQNGPWVFFNRDPLSEETQAIVKTVLV